MAGLHIHFSHSSTSLNEESPHHAVTPRVSECWTEQEVDEAEMDYKKMELQASVQDTYAVCSALLTSFCVCTIFINHDDVDHEFRVDPLRYFALLGNQVIVRICTALGIYAMLIFMLSAMYSKTALSKDIHAEELFLYFRDETEHSRKYAFNAMYYSCFMYLVSIALGLFYSVHGTAACVSSVFVIAIMAYLAWETHGMMGIAKLFFMKDDSVFEKLEQEGYKVSPPFDASPSKHLGSL